MAIVQVVSFLNTILPPFTYLLPPFCQHIAKIHVCFANILANPNQSAKYNKLNIVKHAVCQIEEL